MLASTPSPGEEIKANIAPRASTVRKKVPRSNLRVDVKLVLIPVTVTDPFGAPFAGLARSAFRLYESGIEQEIKYFSAEDASISLGVVFDASRSMSGKLDQSRAAVSEFFHTGMPGDEYFAVEFSDAPRLLCGFTSDAARIEKSLANIVPENWTALLDAVYLAVHEMKHAHNPRKALLILSDGGDNNSRYTEREMKLLVREADVCIYSIALVGSGLFRRYVPLLKELSTETGGRVREIERIADLPAAVQAISEAIRHQYVLGYSPRNSGAKGIYRRVQVRLEPPPDLPRLRASWRKGYYSE